jgi:hypothetical protein
MRNGLAMLLLHKRQRINHWPMLNAKKHQVNIYFLRCDPWRSRCDPWRSTRLPERNHTARLATPDRGLFPLHDRTEKVNSQGLRLFC